MTIQIRRTFIDGTVQFVAGQILDLPAELAQQLVDDGRAVETDESTPDATDISGFVPQSRKQKGKRR